MTTPDPAPPPFEDFATHPHDSLVQRFLTRPEIAAVQLRATLPAALTACFDWPTLRIASGTYIDPKLRPRRGDILYAVDLRDTRKPAFVYVLLEHQSTPQRMMAFRLLQYACRLWERYEREQPGLLESLPLVIPLVLYQGADGWPGPRRLSELLDVPADLLVAHPSPIELTFVVDELTASVRDDALATTRAIALLEVTRAFLRLAFAPDQITPERVAPLVPLLDVVLRDFGEDDLQALLTYVVSAFGPTSPLRDILYETASQETRAVFATIRDEYIAEGEAKGEAKGMATLLLRLLDQRSLPLTIEIEHQVSSCHDPERLQLWFDRALSATRIEDVFGD
jgi:Putative transposase, YhgA-like